MKLLSLPTLPVVSELPSASILGRLVVLSTDGHVYHDNGVSWDDITEQGESVLQYFENSDLAESISEDDNLLLRKIGVSVLDAGTSSANGFYAYRGQYNEKPYYTLEGTNPLVSAISGENGSDHWHLYDSGGDELYESGNAATPQDANWGVAGHSGSLPAPTVTISSDLNIKTIKANSFVLINPNNEALAIASDDILYVKQNDIVVSGAGTEVANGPYTFFGMLNGRPSYVYSGSSDPTANGIYWSSLDTAWRITKSGISNAYGSTDDDDVASPNLATFTVENGDSPAPIVTAAPSVKSVTTEIVRQMPNVGENRLPKADIDGNPVVSQITDDGTSVDIATGVVTVNRVTNAVNVSGVAYFDGGNERASIGTSGAFVVADGDINRVSLGDTTDSGNSTKQIIDDSAQTIAFTAMIINIGVLPTSDPRVAGQLWSNLGVVMISAG